MKFIFFDIDGTLVYNNHGKEIIPESTIRTIEKLKEKGHIVAVATGRSLATVLPVTAKLGIHHIVSDGGNGLVIADEIKHINPLDKEFVDVLTQELIAKKIPFAYMSDPIKRKIKASPLMLAYQNIYSFEDFTIEVSEDYDYLNEKAYKIFVNIKSGEEECVQTINLKEVMRYHDDCLAIEPEDKYKGMKELVKYFQGDEKDIVFFGDGYNDRSVVLQAPLSIAMGNAVDALKDISSFVTKDILDDGIEYACQHFKLI